jgi:hypothetical protein
LVFYVLPEVYRQHPSNTRLKALFAAIELMEAEVRKEQSKERTTWPTPRIIAAAPRGAGGQGQGNRAARAKRLN